MRINRKQLPMQLRDLLSISILLIAQCICVATTDAGIDDIDSGPYQIEGRILAPELETNSVPNWQRNTVISINDGEYTGYLTEKGEFVISGIPAGSYVVDIVNADYYYESVRVEINNRGKFRARKLNYVQPSQVVQLPYPLRMKAATRFKYFQTREQWKITDLLFSPMILMMVLPLILMVILPKMMNDPDTKRDMENININKLSSDMPEISEVLTSFFTGGTRPPAQPRRDDRQRPIAAKQAKKQR